MLSEQHLKHIQDMCNTFKKELEFNSIITFDIILSLLMARMLSSSISTERNSYTLTTTLMVTAKIIGLITLDTTY